jgi:hypothetical protein
MESDTKNIQDNDEQITLDQLIEKLQKIKKDIGHGNTIVWFDTEASNFNCHVVPIYDVSYLEKDIVDDKDYIVLTTKHHYN